MHIERRVSHVPRFRESRRHAFIVTMVSLACEYWMRETWVLGYQPSTYAFRLMGVCSRVRNCHRVAFHCGPTRTMPMRNSTLNACPQHRHFRHSLFPLISFSIFCWPLWHFPAANSLIKPINVIREAFPRQLPLYVSRRWEATRLPCFSGVYLHGSRKDWTDLFQDQELSNMFVISAPGAVQCSPLFQHQELSVCVSALGDLQIMQKMVVVLKCFSNRVRWVQHFEKHWNFLCSSFCILVFD